MVTPGREKFWEASMKEYNRRYLESCSFPREAVSWKSSIRPWTERHHRADDCRIANALARVTYAIVRRIGFLDLFERWWRFHNFFLSFSRLGTKRASIERNRAGKSGVDSLERILEGQREVDYRITDVEWKLKRAIERKDGKKERRKKKRSEILCVDSFRETLLAGETRIHVS